MPSSVPRRTACPSALVVQRVRVQLRSRFWRRSAATNGEPVCASRSCPRGHSARCSASSRHGGGHLTAGRAQCPREVERRERTGDDHPHDDHRARAAVRPPPSRSRPPHGGRNHRHRSRGSSLDGPWLAPRGTESRRHPGRGDEPENIRTPAGDRGAPATREEAHGSPSARPRPACLHPTQALERGDAGRRRGLRLVDVTT
jgi:hypothetical protein